MTVRRLPLLPLLPLLRRVEGRKGVALLAVLWVLALLGTVAAFGLAEVRTGLAATGNRRDAVRGRWRAEGCLAMARASLDLALRRGRDATWYDPVSVGVADCDVQADMPPDVPVDVNVASFEQLRALPGFDDRLAFSVLEQRRWGARITAFAGLTAIAAPEQEARLLEAYADLRTAISYEPLAWLVTADRLVTERWVRGQARVAVIGRLIR